MLCWLKDSELDVLVMYILVGGIFVYFSSEFCQVVSCMLELGKVLFFG